MNSATKKIVSAGMALLMSMSVAVSASAAITVPNVNNIIGDVNRTVTETKRTIDNASTNVAQKADGYWSSQFSQNGQTAYMMIVNAAKQGKTSTPIPNIPDSERKQFPDVLRKEHPELFYMSKNLHWSSYTDNGKTTYKETWTLDSNWQSKKSALDNAVSGFLSGAPTSGSDYDKELYVHDKLVKDTNYQKGKGDAYCALVSHVANCDGYASAMKILLNQLNVPCEIVTGTATGEGAHAWNVVTLNGQKVLTDTCWDDPDSHQATISHRWFNLSASEMNRDHKATNASDQSGCSSSSLNWYGKNGKTYASAAAAEPAISEQMKTQTVVIAKVPNSTEAKKVFNDWKNGKVKMPSKTAWNVELSETQNGFANGVLVFYKTEKK